MSVCKFMGSILDGSVDDLERSDLLDMYVDQTQCMLFFYSRGYFVSGVSTNVVPPGPTCI